MIFSRDDEKIMALYDELTKRLDVIDDIVRNRGSRNSLQERMIQVENDIKGLVDALKPFLDTDLPALRRIVETHDSNKVLWVQVGSGIITALVSAFLIWITPVAMHEVVRPPATTHQKP